MDIPRLVHFTGAAFSVFVLVACSAGPEPEPTQPRPTIGIVTAIPVEPAPQPAQVMETAGVLPKPEVTVPGVITLNAVGDIMLARDLITLMDQNGSTYPYDAVADILSAADITLGNLEGTFTDGGVQAAKFYTFRTPSRHAPGLAEAGFDVVSLGNNHAMDFGTEGLADTLAALEGAGIAYSGAGMNAAEARQPAILEVKGVRIAFLSYNAAALYEAFPAGDTSPGIAVAQAVSVAVDVGLARDSADIVVVSLHAGSEYMDAVTAEQQTLARAAIDAGAVVVLGHHPHVLQGWEQYGSGYIFYSLGNFVFDLDFDDLATLGSAPFQSVVLRLVLTTDGVQAFEMVPVFIEPAQNRPVPAEGERLEAIETRLELLQERVP